MSRNCPAYVGMRLEDIETPALVVELNAFENNLQVLADFLNKTGVFHRAHAKTHKCPIIAQKQIEHGAIGICCQKVSEAEEMVKGGIKNILITNEIVDPRKIERLANLAARAKISVCIDDPLNLTTMNDAAKKFHIKFPVLVEINVGSDRGGIDPGPKALTLARKIDKESNLNFIGLQAYHGSAQHKRNYYDRKMSIKNAVNLVHKTKNLITEAGLNCNVISGGGTGTFHHEVESGLYTEIQAGSYIFMDADYGKNLNDKSEFFNEFKQALFIYATVISTAVPGQVLIDVGHKAHSSDSGYPLVNNLTGVEYINASDEHGILKIVDPTLKFTIGDRVILTPGHVDPTCNLHEYYVVVSDGVVRALWPITARGPGL